jgi:hypothetical protein
MSVPRSLSLLGWVACGRGLRRTKQAFRTMSEYDVWVSERDVNDGGLGRPDQSERIQPLESTDDGSAPTSAPG